MPSVGTTEQPRILLDESSFDFRGLTDADIERHLDNLNTTLTELRTAVSRPPMWDAVECLDQCELSEFLSRAHPSHVDRDTLLLTYRLLDRCREWEQQSNWDVSPVIAGSEPKLAMSAGYALHLALAHRHAAACLVFASVSRRGFVRVSGTRGDADIFFFEIPTALPRFWRGLYAFENVPESKFFELGKLAFPQLVLHESLSFRRFEGSYIDLRDRVVEILGGLCDEFAAAFRQYKGVTHDIQAALGSGRLDVSPESPNVRAKPSLMKQREVVHDGVSYRCEWHAKLERHRNRIHFAEPAQLPDGKILIGLFVRHLDT